jgi:hypothetical protein
MNVSYSTASIPARGLTQPPIHKVPWPVLLEVNVPKREADHSLAPSAEVKNRTLLPFLRMYS